MLVKAPRGTSDFLPGRIERWQWLIKEARAVFEAFGYREVITPIFEHTELFERGIGDTTDVVNKQMYTFSDKGGRSLTLRPEWTAPVVRAYLEHNMDAQPQPVKLYYIGPSFRYERPQAGRYRQFHQMGAEAIGSADPALDAEMIAMAIEIYSRLGLGNFLVKLNSIGCPNCRARYRDALKAHIAPQLERLCPTCQGRYEKNPLRIVDCKGEICREVASDGPRSVDFLCAECSEHFGKVQSILKALKIKYELDHMLVRGLDYYTRTVFEVESLDLGAQSALSGGGRYDGLVEECGGSATPGVGFAAGMERAIGVMEEQGIEPPNLPHVDVFVISLGDSSRLQALSLVHGLRRAGLIVDTDYLERSMRAQMKAANRARSRVTVILGEDELKEGVVQVRDMQNGEQTEIPMDDVVGQLTQRLLQ